MGFYGGTLAAHNHTSTPGDGGVLSNLGISGTVTASGVATAANGTLTTNLATLNQAMQYGLLGGN